MVGCKVEWNVLDKDHRWEWGSTTLLAEAMIPDSLCTYAYGPTLRERLFKPQMDARISLPMQNKFESKRAQVPALWIEMDTGANPLPDWQYRPGAARRGRRTSMCSLPCQGRRTPARS